MSLFNDLASNRKRAAKAKEDAKPFGIYAVKKNGQPAAKPTLSVTSWDEGQRRRGDLERLNPGRNFLVIQKSRHPAMAPRTMNLRALAARLQVPESCIKVNPAEREGHGVFPGHAFAATVNDGGLVTLLLAAETGEVLWEDEPDSSPWLQKPELAHRYYRQWMERRLGNR